MNTAALWLGYFTSRVPSFRIMRLQRDAEVKAGNSRIRADTIGEANVNLSVSCPLPFSDLPGSQRGPFPVS